MVPAFLREKAGLYYIVVSYYDEDHKRKQIWISKKLKVKSEKYYLKPNETFRRVGDVVKQNVKGKTEVEEGTVITIYVCAGYQFDITIDFADYGLMGLIDGEYEISLWQNGVQVKNQGGTIDTAALATYTFKGVKSTVSNPMHKYTVKIKDANGSYVLCDVTCQIGTEPIYAFDYQNQTFPTESLGSDSEILE